MSASSFAFAFADSIVMLDLARFVQGLSGAASWAGAMAWVASAAPPGRRGEMIGTTMGAAIAGALAGPALGALADAVGIAPTFCAVGFLGIGLAAVAATRSRRRRRAPRRRASSSPRCATAASRPACG